MHLVEASGAKIPAIGLGTWTLEGSHCSEIVSAALAGGYRHVDTAAIYGNEEAVGRGLRESAVARDEIFVTTKVWWTDIGRGALERSAERSLARLGLDTVDLLLIHWPNPRIPLEESIDALNSVRRRGLTRHIGVSNFPTSLLRKAIALSEAPFVCNQVEYHSYLSQQKVKQLCDEAGMAMVAYCPLFRGGPLFGEPAVRAASQRHGKTPGQIILRWHVQQPGLVCIPRTSKIARLAENIAIFDFQLSDEEMTAISALSVRNSRICDYEFSPSWDVA